MRAPDLALSTTMAKANKPLVFCRSGLLVLFLLLSSPHGANAEFGGGVLGFLRNLEFAVEKRTLWFYRFFGANLHPSKLNLAKDCDYNDVEKIRFCPPALNPAMYGDVNPNLAVNPNVAATTKTSGDMGGTAEKSLPSKCLEDPDDPECREFRDLQSPGNSPPVAAPGTWVTDFPVGAVSTAAPTKDMCYGNMAKNPKFCNSEMPSVSTEPSEQPTGFPPLSQPGERPGTDGLAFPSIGGGPGNDALLMPSLSGQSDSPSDVPSESPSGQGGPGNDGLVMPSIGDQSDSPSDVPR